MSVKNKCKLMYSITWMILKWIMLKVGEGGGVRNWESGIYIYTPKWSEVTQSCPTLCDPMNCSPPGSSVHGIFQARILEWVAISFFRGSSQPRDQTQVSCIAGRCFNLWVTREAQIYTLPCVKQTASGKLL